MFEQIAANSARQYIDILVLRIHYPVRRGSSAFCGDALTLIEELVLGEAVLLHELAKGATLLAAEARGGGRHSRSLPA